MTFPTAEVRTAPTHTLKTEFQCPRGLGDFSHIGGVIALIRRGVPRFNAREGLVTFPTQHRDYGHPTRQQFQCPRGLGDFSHGLKTLLFFNRNIHRSFNAREGLVTFPTQPVNVIYLVYQDTLEVSMPARAW